MSNNKLSANEYKMLLFEYVARSRSENVTMPQNPIAIKTITTSDMAEEIASDYGVSIYYVSPNTSFIDIPYCEEERCIFSFFSRDDYDGYTVDQVNAEEEMRLYYQDLGMSLEEGMDALYEKYGYFEDDLLWLNYEDHKKVSYIMTIMRMYMPHTVGGYEIVKAVNYEVKTNKKEKRDKISGVEIVNILEYILHNEARMIIHPSFHDSKIGIHLFAKGKSKDMVHHVLNNLEKYIKIELLS